MLHIKSCLRIGLQSSWRSRFAAQGPSFHSRSRLFSTKFRGQSDEAHKRNVKTGYYMGTLIVFVFGMSYAAVPLYKVFCQMTGFGGTTQLATESSLKNITPVENGKILEVHFTSNVHDTMPWSFEPAQKEVKLVPGETALAFYTVKNNADYPITGVATYNVYPPKVGLYFNKIQCFCFEEQRLAAGEEIDMPVFFFIDPEFVEDPAMDNTTYITLSYTFFKTGDEKHLKQESSRSS